MSLHYKKSALCNLKTVEHVLYKKSHLFTVFICLISSTSTCTQITCALILYMCSFLIVSCTYTGYMLQNKLTKCTAWKIFSFLGWCSAITLNTDVLYTACMQCNASCIYTFFSVSSSLAFTSGSSGTVSTSWSGPASSAMWLMTPKRAKCPMYVSWHFSNKSSIIWRLVKWPSSSS